MSSYVHIDNKGKYIFIFVERSTQGLDNTTLMAKAKYPVSFMQPNEIFVLSLHYSEINSFLFVNATKIYHFKAKNSKIKDYALCLENISNDFTINKKRH